MTAYERTCGCRVHNPPAVWPQRDWLCPYHEGEVDGYDRGWHEALALNMHREGPVDRYRQGWDDSAAEALRLHREGLL